MLERLHVGWLTATLVTMGTVVSTVVPVSAQEEEEAPESEAEVSEEEAEADLGTDIDPDAQAEPVLEAEPEADTSDDESGSALSEPEAEEAAEEEAAAVEEAATESEAPARPAGPALRFANSYLSWTNAFTTWTLDPTSGITYNPTFWMSWNLTPRFYLTDTTFLWLNQGLSLELTDSDDGAYNREPLLDDTLLDIRQNLSWEGFVFQFQGRLGFPLSKLSQAAGRVMQTGLGLIVTRPIPEAANLTISANFGYRRWWATRNVPAAGPTENQVGYCRPSTPGSAEEPACTQASGSSSFRDILVSGLTLSVAPLPELTIMFQGIFVWAYAHELGEEQVEVNGGTVTVRDESPTHWRNFTYLMLAVAYDVLPWLNIQLGIQNSGILASTYNPDGSVRSPFNADTQIFLSTTFTLDTLYDTIFSASDDGLTPEERQRRRQGLARNAGGASF